jgi:hypothetical protein
VIEIVTLMYAHPVATCFFLFFLAIIVCEASKACKK